MKLQDYTKEPLIKGVEISTPQVHKDCGGEFREIGRFTVYQEDGLVNTPFNNEAGEIYKLQVNHSILEPGTIKAFHLHKKQTDLWYLLNKGIVVLYDLREGSDTFKIQNRFILENQKVLIPPGVAHGIGNPYLNKLHMIYFTDQFFNPKDEFRLPWDTLGETIWEIQKG